MMTLWGKNRLGAVALATVAAISLAACGSSASDASSTRSTPRGGPTTRVRGLSATMSTLDAAPANSTVAPVDERGDGSGNIVGGQPIAITDAPWLVALVKHEARDAATGQLCGGALLNPTTVLTAAHCLHVTPQPDGSARTTRRPSALDVVIGRSRLQDRGGERIRLKSFAVPGTWTGDAQDGSDLAVLILSKPSKQRVKVLLPPDNNTYGTIAGQRARAQGWGCHGTSGTEATVADCRAEAATPPVLKAGIIEFRNASDCVALDASFNTDGDLCGGGLDAQTSGCWGDSGGPLTVQTTGGSTFVVGIVSYGLATTAAGEPMCATNTPSAWSYVSSIWTAWKQQGFRGWSFAT